jgi:putative addiction module component (TIGR02574 family)
VSELLKQAMEIPTEARAALASSLFESLDGQLDASAEEDWKQEIARRIAELDSGKVKPVPRRNRAGRVGNPSWQSSHWRFTPPHSKS